MVGVVKPVLLTINVLVMIQVDAHDAPIGEGQYDDIVGDLDCCEVSGYLKPQLNALDDEDGQVIQFRDGARYEAVARIECHTGIESHS